MSDIPSLTRAELADILYSLVGLSRAESLDMVESIIEHMSDAMAKGENVKIAGFGTFLLLDKNERVGRNPKTGVEATIAPRRVLTFRASKMLKDKVGRG